MSETEARQRLLAAGLIDEAGQLMPQYKDEDSHCHKSSYLVMLRVTTEEEHDPQFFADWIDRMCNMPWLKVQTLVVTDKVSHDANKLTWSLGPDNDLREQAWTCSSAR